MYIRDQMAQRERDEVMSLILQSATEGATRTKLMHDNYLSFEALQEYLISLQKMELLEYHEGEMTFKTTEKGSRFLSANQKVRSEACCHQCKKCGCLYCCNEHARCGFPFLNGTCQGCSMYMTTKISI